MTQMSTLKMAITRVCPFIQQHIDKQQGRLSRGSRSFDVHEIESEYEWTNSNDGRSGTVDIKTAFSHHKSGVWK